MRRVLNHWFYATRRKQSLAEREEEFSRSLVSQAFEKWRDRFLENSLREVVWFYRLFCALLKCWQ